MEVSNANRSSSAPIEAKPAQIKQEKEVEMKKEIAKNSAQISAEKVSEAVEQDQKKKDAYSGLDIIA